jgi:hypothetical protein
MSSLLSNDKPSIIGEKGSLAFPWSKSIQERIIQFNFQIVRSSNTLTHSNLQDNFNKLINDIILSYQAKTISQGDYTFYITILYKLIAFTRDIKEGKGEYTLSYILLKIWYKYFPTSAEYLLQYFVLPLPSKYTNDLHPFGSWKDIKLICEILQSGPFYDYCLQLLVNQLKVDLISENPSLAAKWAPREKSKHKIIFTNLAKLYFPEYFQSAKTPDNLTLALLKAKTQLRHIISTLNRRLDTVQIKQCNQQWSNINPNKITSITLHKQKRAFLNINFDGSEKYNKEDRIQCKKHFLDYLEKIENKEINIKGQRIGIHSFIQEALELIENNQTNTSIASFLNEQWSNTCKIVGDLGKIIPMVDVSGSMHGNPLYAAIGLGLIVADKSMLGNRILTFSTEPSWINLSNCNNFIEKVQLVNNGTWDMSTNFNAALSIILDAIILTKLKPDDVEDMVLAIFSDMQIDAIDSNYTNISDIIEEKYTDAGIRLYNKPFKVPHILFWNLRSTDNFPSLSTSKNCSMMSGFNPTLLNLFCEQGIYSLQSCSPWNLFLKSINNNRYKLLEEQIQQYL